MAVSANHNLGGHVIQLRSYLIDIGMKNYRGFQGYRPFHMVLQDCSEFTMAYLDDIIIFSRNEHEHLKHIKIIFQKLIDAGLKLKESKCDFFKKEIHYLGHLISSEGIHHLKEKLDTICNMPRPKTPKEIKQFLLYICYVQLLVLLLKIDKHQLISLKIFILNG